MCFSELPLLAALRASVLLSVLLAGVGAFLVGHSRMAARVLRMMGAGFGLPFVIRFCSVAVTSRGIFVVIGCLVVMFA